MEIIGGIVLSLVAMVLLAALGLTTVFALGFMMILGLLTNISFKRLFFISFAMGLAAPILLGAATFAAFEDGSLERELRAELGDVITLPDDAGPGSWRDALPRLRELQSDIENGDLENEEIERRIEEVFSDAGVQLNLDEIEAGNEDDAIQITID